MPANRTVMVNGQRHTLVHESANTWSSFDNGQLVHHVGTIHEAYIPAKVLDEPLPCAVCKQPALTATPRQRTKGQHPSCSGITDVLVDEAYYALVFDVALQLGAQIITDTPRETRDVRRAA